MRALLNSPKTTFGGVVILAAVALLFIGKVTVEQAITLMGLAAGWIGLTSSDHKDGGQ